MPASKWDKRRQLALEFVVVPRHMQGYHGPGALGPVPAKRLIFIPCQAPMKRHRAAGKYF